MQNLHGQLATLCHKLADMALLLAALGLTIVLNYAPESHLDASDYALNFLSTRVKIGNVILCLVMLGVWHAAFRWRRLYERPRWGDWRAELENLAQAVLIAAAALLATAQLGRWPTVRLWTVICFAFIGFAFTGGLCGLLRLRRRHLLQQGRNLKALLVVGGGARAERFIRRAQEKQSLGYRLIGYLESDPALGRRDLAGVRWRGRVEDLPRLVNTEVLDEVVVALPIKSHYAQIETALAVLEEQGLSAHLLSDFFPHRRSQHQALEWYGMHLLTLHSAPPFSWRTEVKRALDLVLAAALLVIFAPLMAFIALLIKLDSRGPVLFVQERMGYNKRRFRMFKFRTMTQDAEARMAEIEHLNEKSGPIFKIRHDPRVTRLGGLLRRTSLDELPQLFNVLFGDMSLVGPRPLSLRDALGLSEAWQKRRFSVKPGLTCLWQVSGRSNLSFEEWMQLDLEYIDHWTLGLDCRILLRTVPAVLQREGAV
jgi:exopolysaccharide biosynthesis polyprenyl glycosylphosphotransferase